MTGQKRRVSALDSRIAVGYLCALFLVGSLALRHELDLRELVQIKLTLTCAKTPVNVDAEMEVPGSTEAPVPADCPFETNSPQTFEPTSEEKENLQKLMSKLGL